MKNENSVELTERLLDSWLHLSMNLWNERFVTRLSYNESLVCHLLFMQRKEHPEFPFLTLMQLSHQTGILKSQMNKTLTILDEKGYIVRERSQEDKRIVYITLNEQNLQAYEDQHNDILRVVEKVVDKLGYERSEEAITIFNDIGEQINAILAKGPYET